MYYKKSFIFDLDETIRVSTNDYWLPKKFFVDEMLKIPEIKQKFHHEKILEIANKIDSTRVKGGEIFGMTFDALYFNCQRFPSSLQVTYMFLCNEAGIEPNEKLLKKLYAIGMKAFDKKQYKNDFMHGAKETLDFLLEKDCNLILLTKGDERVQKNKINALNLNKWFEKMYIVKDKDKKTFVELIIDLELETEKTYSVGNSFSSDIKPALEAGIGGIEIPFVTWEFERKEDKKTREIKKEFLRKYNNRYFLINKIEDMKTLYELL